MIRSDIQVSPEGTRAALMYQGYEQGRFYSKGNTLLEDGWLLSSLVSNNTDYPVPQPVSSPAWQVFGTDTPTWAAPETDSTRILSGVRIHSVNATDVGGLRVWIPTIGGTVTYAVLLTNPDSNPVYLEIDPQEIGWFIVLDAAGFMQVGQTVDAYLVTQGQGGTTETFTGSWDFRDLGANPAPGNPVPATGFRYFGTNAPDTAYWSVYDENLDDRTADMATLVAGDEIKFQWLDGSVPIDEYTVWTLAETPEYSAEVEGSEQYILTLSPAAGPPEDANQRNWRDFTATHYAERPLSYVVDAGRFAGNENVRGLLSTDGLDGVVETDDAYGIDVYASSMSASPNWYVLAYTGAGSAVSISGLTPAQAQWVEASAEPFTRGEVTTTGATWTPVLDIPLPKTSRGSLIVTGQKADGSEYIVYRADFVAHLDGTFTPTLQETSNINTTHGRRIRAKGGASGFTVEVKGYARETWQWQAMSFESAL